MQVHSKVGHFQLCDILDPLCRSLIDSTDGILPFCSSDINEGWYAYDYFEQIRQVVRRKWQGLLNGIEVTTEDCEDLLRWQCSKESRVGQGRRRAAAATTNALTGVAPRKKKGAKQAKGDAGTSEQGDDEEQDEQGGGESEDAASGSGSGSEGGAGMPLQKGRPYTSKKPIKTAPWEKPKTKRSKAKQPETEAQLVRLARLGLVENELLTWLDDAALAPESRGKAQQRSCRHVGHPRSERDRGGAGRRGAVAWRGYIGTADSLDPLVESRRRDRRCQSKHADAAGTPTGATASRVASKQRILPLLAFQPISPPRDSVCPRMSR